ncbi:MAG: hypothetical protein M0Z72_01325 [Deltaproteobacteria bacterium]|nr:hypothetical protein [Deltaproteobacteria bacterium]
MKKKKNKISAYFNQCAINNYTGKQKLMRGFVKEAAKKLNVPIFICRSELKSARIRLYHRIAYLKNSKKFNYLLDITHIDSKDLIMLILQNDVELTNDGMAKFIRIYQFISSLERIKRIDVEEERKYAWLDLSKFLSLICREINKTSKEGYISAALLDDRVFFCTYVLAEALKKLHGDTYITKEERQESLRYALRKFRELDILAEKINGDYYSNTVRIKYSDGSVYDAHGIFLKTSGLTYYFDNNIEQKIEGLEEIAVSKKNGKI